MTDTKTDRRSFIKTSAGAAAAVAIGANATMTTAKEEIAVAQEGSFPEVKGREPPAQFPSQPPPVSDQPGREEGPPRKSQRVR